MRQSGSVYLVESAARTWAAVVFFSNTSYVSIHPTQPVPLVAKSGQEEPVNCAPLGILQLTEVATEFKLGIQLSKVNPICEQLY